jgi:hypothetical protein
MKFYQPRITVTLKREFDGKAEYEISASEVGSHAQLLEQIVRAAIGLSLQTKQVSEEAQ